MNFEEHSTCILHDEVFQVFTISYPGILHHYTLFYDQNNVCVNSKTIIACDDRVVTVKPSLYREFSNISIPTEKQMLRQTSILLLYPMHPYYIYIVYLLYSISQLCPMYRYCIPFTLTISGVHRYNSITSFGKLGFMTSDNHGTIYSKSTKVNGPTSGFYYRRSCSPVFWSFDVFCLMFVLLLFILGLSFYSNILQGNLRSSVAYTRIYSLNNF